MIEIFFNPFIPEVTEKLYLVDLDGTICYDACYNTVFGLFLPFNKLLDWTAEQASFSPLAIITNQSGIGRGYYEYCEFRSYITKIVWYLEIRHNLIVNSVFVCPHAPSQNCLCRKPDPFMLRRAFESLTPRNVVFSSIYLGDKASDKLSFVSSRLVGQYIMVSEGSFEEF
jgi:D-glycero-D-manno-heptose 1,7-bisphosphate phosphatase